MRIAAAPAALLGIVLGTFGLTLGTSFAASTAPSIGSTGGTYGDNNSGTNASGIYSDVNAGSYNGQSLTNSDWNQFGASAESASGTWQLDPSKLQGAVGSGGSTIST